MTDKAVERAMEAFDRLQRFEKIREEFKSCQLIMLLHNNESNSASRHC